jgi:hypothetical protein
MKFVKQMSRYFSDTKEEYIADECDTYKILGEPSISIMEYAQEIRDEKSLRIFSNVKYKNIGHEKKEIYRICICSYYYEYKFEQL